MKMPHPTNFQITMATCFCLLLGSIASAQAAATNEWLTQFTTPFSKLYKAAGSTNSVDSRTWRSSYQRPPPSQHIIDISLSLDKSTVQFANPSGLGESFRTLFASQAAGDSFTGSFLQLGAHTATHVDSPGHFLLDAYQSGMGTESLDLDALNGPVLVVETPTDSNITAAVINQLNIPPGTIRIIFKTTNTARQLLHKTAFDSSYIAMTRDGGAALAARGDVKMVGIDYLSIAYFDDLEGAHVELLSKGLIVVEGLVLDDVAPGLYTVHCLPLKIVGSDGAPARCILLP